MKGTGINTNEAKYEFKFIYSDLLVGMSFAAGIFILGNICSKTVSYTHLDVYKRQHTLMWTITWGLRIRIPAL